MDSAQKKQRKSQLRKLRDNRENLDRIEAFLIELRQKPRRIIVPRSMPLSSKPPHVRHPPKEGPDEELSRLEESLIEQLLDLEERRRELDQQKGIITLDKAEEREIMTLEAQNAKRRKTIRKTKLFKPPTSSHSKELDRLIVQRRLLALDLEDLEFTGAVNRNQELLKGTEEDFQRKTESIRQKTNELNKVQALQYKLQAILTKKAEAAVELRELRDKKGLAERDLNRKSDATNALHIERSSLQKRAAAIMEESSKLEISKEEIYKKRNKIKKLKEEIRASEGLYESMKHLVHTLQDEIKSLEKRIEEDNAKASQMDSSLHQSNRRSLDDAPTRNSRLDEILLETKTAIDEPLMEKPY